MKMARTLNETSKNLVFIKKKAKKEADKAKKKMLVDTMAAMLGDVLITAILPELAQRQLTKNAAKQAARKTGQEAGEEAAGDGHGLLGIRAGLHLDWQHRTGEEWQVGALRHWLSSQWPCSRSAPQPRDTSGRNLRSRVTIVIAIATHRDVAFSTEGSQLLAAVFAYRDATVCAHRFATATL